MLYIMQESSPSLRFTPIEIGEAELVIKSRQTHYLVNGRDVSSLTLPHVGSWHGDSPLTDIASLTLTLTCKILLNWTELNEKKSFPPFNSTLTRPISDSAYINYIKRWGLAGISDERNNWFYTPFKIFYNFIFYESMRENNKGYFSAHQNWENP